MMMSLITVTAFVIVFANIYYFIASFHVFHKLLFTIVWPSGSLHDLVLSVMWSFRITNKLKGMMKLVIRNHQVCSWHVWLLYNNQLLLFTVDIYNKSACFSLTSHSSSATGALRCECERVLAYSRHGRMWTMPSVRWRWRNSRRSSTMASKWSMTWTPMGVTRMTQAVSVQVTADRYVQCTCCVKSFTYWGIISLTVYSLIP